MRCHVCGAQSAYAPEHRHVKVGLCETHIKHYMDSLERSDALRGLDPDESGVVEPI